MENFSPNQPNSMYIPELSKQNKKKQYNFKNWIKWILSNLTLVDDDVDDKSIGNNNDKIGLNMPIGFNFSFSFFSIFQIRMDSLDLLLDVFSLMSMAFYFHHHHHQIHLHTECHPKTDTTLFTFFISKSKYVDSLERFSFS